MTRRRAGWIFRHTGWPVHRCQLQSTRRGARREPQTQPHNGEEPWSAFPGTSPWSDQTIRWSDRTIRASIKDKRPLREFKYSTSARGESNKPRRGFALRRDSNFGVGGLKIQFRSVDLPTKSTCCYKHSSTGWPHILGGKIRSIQQVGQVTEPKAIPSHPVSKFKQRFACPGGIPLK